MKNLYIWASLYILSHAQILSMQKIVGTYLRFANLLQLSVRYLRGHLHDGSLESLRENSG